VVSSCSNTKKLGQAFLGSHQSLSYRRICQHFMEPVNSLSHSREPSIGPHSEPEQSSSFNPIVISLKSISILSSHLRLGLSSDLFRSDFPTEILYPCQSHLNFLDHSNYSWWRVQVMKLVIVQFSQTSCHFISLRPKYSPQHLFSNVRSLCSSLSARDQIWHPQNTKTDKQKQQQ
jgi:hypothetical protein